MLPEGGRHPSLASSSTSLSGRPLTSSAYSAVVPAQKAPAANGKTNSALPPAHVEDSSSKNEVVKKPTNHSDPKTNKLHIRDDIENLSTQKSSEIYSGLGLDVSPSSSLNDSPLNSEGLSNNLKDSQFESPTSILQIMTSYPMHDGLLLSPLSDDLIWLTEKRKLWGRSGSESIIQENLETSVAFVNGTHDANRKSSDARKPKSSKKDVSANSHGNDDQNAGGVPPNKEIDADVITCEELVSKVSKLPHLSNPYHSVSDPTNDADRITDNPRTAVRGRVTEESSNIALDPFTAMEIDAVDRYDRKVISLGRIVETKCNDAQNTETVKEVSKTDSSVESKSKKISHRDTLLTKGGFEDMKKNHARYTYRDFFGDLEAEEDDDETGLQEIHSPVMPKDSDASRATHSLDENCHQHLGGPNSSGVEKRRKNKEKKSFLDNHSDGGTKNRKMKNTTVVDLNVSSKKIKLDDTHDDENWTFGAVVGKPGWSSTTGLSHSASGKVRDKFKLRDSRDDQMKNLVSAKDLETDKSDASMHMQKSDSKDSQTKRKKSELWDSETCNFKDFMEETCDDIRRKEKKSRVSKSDRKDSGTSKGSGGTGQVKKEQHTRQHLDATTLQSVKGADSSKKDLCKSQPSVAATSSLSKGSGSDRNKTSLQELNASPVESVSSSPLRISNMDRRINYEGKGDCKNSGSFPTSSPKRSSDNENGFSNQSNMVKKGTVGNGMNDNLEFSEVDFEEKDIHRESGTKGERKSIGSGYGTHPDADVNTDPLCQASQHACRTENSDKIYDKERKNDHQCQNNGSISIGGKGYLSRHKEKNQVSKSDSDQCKSKDPGILNLSSDQMPLDEVKMAPGKNMLQERPGGGSDRPRKSSKKDRSDVMSHQDKGQLAAPDRDHPGSSKELVSNKSEQIEVSMKSPLTRDQNETIVFKEPVPGSERGTGVNLLEVDASERGRSNASRHSVKAERHPGNLPNSTAHKARDLDVPSPVRKNSSSQAAANAIKEARNLKHLADRLKNSGSRESTGIYFQAALKFLHAASLQELDCTKHGEMNHSRRIYSSTAKLCQFCAQEYEKLKDMASAALAYKCMEVAYMRVIYSSNSDANRYRNELQTALQIFPPGESPFSSVSDVDNLNNPTMVDKAALAKVVGSPHVAGAHVLSARNSSSVTRLINLAQEVSFAMEASRKSRVAFAAANPGLVDQCKEGTLSVKKALDFNFQDVDGLLRLVRVAMEAISH